MSKYDILPHLNVKIGYLMTKYDIRSQFKYQNRIENVKIQYSGAFECQNRIFCLISMLK